MTDQRPLVYVGVYSEPILFGTGQVLQGNGKGVYSLRFDREAGALAPNHLAEGVRNPSYLCFDPARHFLYCVNEFKQYEGAASGAVSAFRIDPATGALTFLNSRASRGTDPCHLMTDAAGKHLLVANFASGSVSVFPLRDDGSIGESSDFVQHEGSSADPRRQAGPHAHAVEMDEANRFVFVPDLGIDKVMIYAFDAERGTLSPNSDCPWVATAPGAGPRQIVFHPNGRYAYLVNELNATMTAFAYDADKGRLTELQTLPMLPSDFNGANICAEVQITPSGKFLYGSNRGHDSLVIYAIGPDGLMTLVGHEKTRGRTPRNFDISGDGAHLAVANQDTDNIVMFRIDPTTGRLAATGDDYSVGTPVCVRFMD